MEFSFTINSNGAIMAFVAFLVGYSFLTNTDPLRVIIYVSVALIAGVCLAELAWLLPSEDIQNEKRITPDYKSIANTAITIIVGIIFIGVGSYIIVPSVGSAMRIISSPSLVGSLLIPSAIGFMTYSFGGTMCIFIGAWMLLSLFKYDEEEEAS